MPIDTRATVLCWTEDPRRLKYRVPPDRPDVALTVVSGGVSDGYLQGNALISTKGSCVIQGKSRLRQGQRLWLTYTKPFRGSDVLVTREVPRVLWVLSFFVDPIRGTTTIELGCPFTYYKDYKKPKIVPSDPSFVDVNGDIIEGKSDILTSQVLFKEIVLSALAPLGFFEDNGTLVFKSDPPGGLAIDEFSFDAPFLSVVNDVLFSFCLYAYVTDEISPRRRDPVVVVESAVRGPRRRLASATAGASIPVLTEQEIIDVGPLNFGDLPADSVTVNFTYLKLKTPDDVEVFCDQDEDDDEDDVLERDRAWPSESSFVSNSSSILIFYEGFDGTSTSREYRTHETSQESVEYRVLGERESGEVFFISREDVNEQGQFTKEEGVSYRRVPASRTMSETASSAAILGGYATARLSSGLSFNNYTVPMDTTESFSYDDKGNLSSRTLTRTGGVEHLVGDVAVQMVYDGTPVNFPSGGVVFLEKIVTYYYTSPTSTKVVTERYVPWIRSISGQQTIAEARDSITTLQEANDFISSMLGQQGSVLKDVTVAIDKSGAPDLTAPSALESALADVVDEAGDPNNGFQVSGSSETVFSTGIAGAAGVVVEYSMPYAPDDKFVAYPVLMSDPPRYCYRSMDGGARARATTFGRVQNRIALGVRNGIGVQLAPENIPRTPFAAVVIDLSLAPNRIDDPNRLRATYGVTAASWTFDGDGMVSSFDGIYWGINGR
jgi:hypothetical protein